MAVNRMVQNNVSFHSTRLPQLSSCPYTCSTTRDGGHNNYIGKPRNEHHYRSTQFHIARNIAIRREL
eukprot:13561400-Alexandrium_andersonii.AAC.1